MSVYGCGCSQTNSAFFKGRYAVIKEIPDHIKSYGNLARLIESSEERHTLCKKCHFTICEIVNIVRSTVKSQVIPKLIEVVGKIKAAPEAERKFSLHEFKNYAEPRTFELAFRDATLGSELRVALEMPPVIPYSIIE